MGSEALPSPADINHTLDSPAGHKRTLIYSQAKARTAVVIFQ